MSKQDSKGRYEGFIFPPAVIHEEIDLELDIKKEILFREANLDRWHHYQVLDVRPRTAVSEIRARYLELTRVFHPDRYYGKNLGSYKDRLSRVFQRIQKAWETLSDPDRKAEYDRKNPIQLTEAEKAEVAREAEDEAREMRRREERRERLIRRSPLAKRKAKVEGFVRDAEQAAEKGDWKSAINFYQLAASHEPDNQAIAAKLLQARSRAGAEKAEALRHEAESAEAMGRLDQAVAKLEEAVEADGRNVVNHLTLVRTLLLLGDAAERATEVGRAATQLAPRSAQAWTAYGHALAAGGDKKSAKNAFQKAVDLDATAEEAKVALKSLRWSLF